MSAILSLARTEIEFPAELTDFKHIDIDTTCEVTFASAKESLHKFNDENVTLVHVSEQTPLNYLLAAKCKFPTARLILQTGSEYLDVITGESLNKVEEQSDQLPEQLEEELNVKPSAETMESVSSELEKVQFQQAPLSDETASVENNRPIDKKTLSASQASSENKSKPKKLAEAEKETTLQSQTPKANAKKSKLLAEMTDKELLFDMFLKATWDGDVQQIERRKEEYLTEVNQRAKANPLLLKRALKCWKQGEEVLTRWQRDVEPMQKNTSVEGKLAFDKFWQNYESDLKSQQKDKIIKSLKFKIKKAEEYAANKKKLHQVNKRNKFKSYLPMVQFEHHHPNSIRHLPEDNEWHIVIDETGKSFGAEAQGIANTDQKLGRCVALVIPNSLDKKQAILPSLANYHAVDESNKVNDETIARVLNTSVGVLGFTVNDEVNYINKSWFGAIEQLIKWCIFLLPLKTEGQRRIKFFIEQKDYNSSHNLDMLMLSIEHQLAEINPDYFSNVKLKAEFIAKDGHKYNGYVDCIAHMWAPSNKERMRRSRMKGHCLLEPNHQTLERLYASLTNAEQLPADTWFKLITELDSSSNTLGEQLLNNLADVVKNDSVKWQSYAKYVQDNLSSLHYQPHKLLAAINWLDAHKQGEQQLSAILEFEWLSAKLASANHLGQHQKDNSDLLARLAQLSAILIDEDIRKVCQSHIRTAISLTNQFEFEQAKQLLTPWLAEETKVIGRENKGKLLSTYGQLLAFQQQHAESQSYFELAIAEFSKLSDEQLKQRHINQTKSYLVINQLDNNQAQLSDVKALLKEVVCNSLQITDFDKAIRNLANMNFEQHSRFAHYVLLRGFAKHPGSFTKEITIYLKNKDNWASNDGHPWQLVNFYRAILLQQNNQTDDALSYAIKAIEQCCEQDSGDILHWMAHVLYVSAEIAGIKLPMMDIDIIQVPELHQLLPNLPADKLFNLQQSSQTDFTRVLAECLPFNFH